LCLPAAAAAAAAAECRTFPHIAHLTVAIVFSLVFIAVAGLFALADVTPNPVSQNWLATAHATVEFKTWVFKTMIVICANALNGFLKLQVTPIMIFTAWIAYVHIRWVSRALAVGSAVLISVLVG
jgi:lipopolysaccharide/colanic/teichoic acid biosynthesis glycosyltransferase